MPPSAAVSRIRGDHLGRHYAWYSGVQRAKAARGTWARFLKKVFAADPLVCPDCRCSIRIVAFIEELRVVRAIREHLSLWDAPRPATPPVTTVGPADFEYVPCED